jgi:nitroreductase
MRIEIMHPALELIESRSSINLFDPHRTVSDAEITELIRLATKAPTVFNLQNWRFVTVRSAAAKARLREAANNQPKVTDTSVVFIIAGTLPDSSVLEARLRPFIDSGHMPAAVAQGWIQGAAKIYADPVHARDEAVRSAALGASLLMMAASALGLSTGPMVGFDADAVISGFGFGPHEIPVMLVAAGYALPHNWPQKPRLPVQAVLEFV